MNSIPEIKLPTLLEEQLRIRIGNIIKDIDSDLTEIPFRLKEVVVTSLHKPFYKSLLIAILTVILKPYRAIM